MTIPPIALEDFSWEAFATLVGAFGAVIGAVWVGLRQSGISDRQSRIIERQVGLEELKLRHDLFERRMTVNDDVRRLLSYIAIHADAPAHGHPLTTGLLIAIDRAQFLFPSQVHEDLSALWVRYVD